MTLVVTNTKTYLMPDQSKNDTSLFPMRIQEGCVNIHSWISQFIELILILKHKSAKRGLTFCLQGVHILLLRTN